MKKKLLILMTALTLLLAGTRKNDAGNGSEPAADPLNGTYIIQGNPISLTAGRSEQALVPGSATRQITTVHGAPVYGNLDGKGGIDAALALVHDPGGSGTFLYVGAALMVNACYQGTAAALVGDRVALQDIHIHNGVIAVSYKDRRQGEPMSASPFINRTRYFVLEGKGLEEIPGPAAGDEMLGGWVTIGHEVRSFTPCFQDQALWLQGRSPALADIMEAYGKSLPDPMPYTPLFMILSGKVMATVADGFGADYQGSFRASRLVHSFAQGNCKSDLIFLEAPLPGARVQAPLKIRGQARGTWFFEGDFPVDLTDARGQVIARGFASAKGPWMTERFVPFQASIPFAPQSKGSSGTLILKKDNPTGNPALDDAIKIPVFFK